VRLDLDLQSSKLPIVRATLEWMDGCEKVEHQASQLHGIYIEKKEEKPHLYYLLL
jgi:hypothetical protein